jgi:hypothetical protein
MPIVAIFVNRTLGRDQKQFPNQNVTKKEKRWGIMKHFIWFPRAQLLGINAILYTLHEDAKSYSFLFFPEAIFFWGGEEGSSRED